MKEDIIRLRAEGKTYSEIHTITGASKGTIAYHCGEGQKDKKNARQSATRYKRLLKVSEFKSSPCVDCGNRFPSECMDFDHVRGKKVERISQLVSHGTWQQVLGEIAKCEVVCANCHRTRTKNRGNAGWNYLT